MKLLIVPGIVVGVLVVVVSAITIFLGPNDMRGCGERPDETEKCRAADAIVAVSGGDTNARTDAAIDLYQRGWASEVIFSGAAQDPDAPSNAQAMKNRAIRRGVPAERVVIEEFSRTTAENAANTSEFINSRQLTRIILVTSAYHQRRANLEFGATLGSTVQVVNAPVTQDSQWSNWWWLTPGGWWLVVGEIVKIIAHHLGGGAA